MNFLFPYDFPDGHETFSRQTGAAPNERIQRLREALGDIDWTDDREDLLESQLASLEPSAGREYIQLLACEAYETFELLNYLLSHLSVATHGSRFAREMGAASYELYGLLEALSITGCPTEVWGGDKASS